MDVTSDRSIIGERATLLLIEDDLKIQTLLTSATKSRGYAVLLAATGADGLRAASLRNPAMVILDLDIAGLASGFSTNPSSAFTASSGRRAAIAVEDWERGLLT